MTYPLNPLSTSQNGTTDIEYDVPEIAKYIDTEYNITCVVRSYRYHWPKSTIVLYQHILHLFTVQYWRSQNCNFNQWTALSFENWENNVWNGGNRMQKLKNQAQKQGKQRQRITVHQDRG